MCCAPLARTLFFAVTTDSKRELDGGEPNPGKTVLNGDDGGDGLVAASDGTLPPLNGQEVDGSVASLIVPAEAVAFVVLEGLENDSCGC